MKNIEHCTDFPYKLEVVPDLDEGGYVVCYPELSGYITVGDSVEHVASNAIDVLSVQGVDG